MCRRAPFSGCVLIEGKHALTLVTTRWQRSVKLILLRSFLVGLPFSGSFLIVPLVFSGALRATDLALYGFALAVFTQAALIAALPILGGAYAPELPLLLLSEARTGGIGGFAWLWRPAAGVSRLEEDECELERTAYCTFVRVVVVVRASAA